MNCKTFQCVFFGSPEHEGLCTLCFQKKEFIAIHCNGLEIPDQQVRFPGGWNLIHGNADGLRCEEFWNCPPSFVFYPSCFAILNDKIEVFVPENNDFRKISQKPFDCPFIFPPVLLGGQLFCDSDDSTVVSIRLDSGDVAFWELGTSAKDSRTSSRTLSTALENRCLKIEGELVHPSSFSIITEKEALKLSPLPSEDIVSELYFHNSQTAASVPTSPEFPMTDFFRKDLKSFLMSNNRFEALVQITFSRRRFRVFMREKNIHRLLALAMASHARLGASSPLAVLESGLLEAVGEILCRDADVY